MIASAARLGRPRTATVLRIGILALLVAAPLALGSVHPPAYVPLLAGMYVIGTLSWARGHWRRAQGEEVPHVPGSRALYALVGLVLLQLVPMPPALLRLVSPGSFRFYDFYALVPLVEWRPITVSPFDTARGLAFLVGMALFYASAFREISDERWRRRLAVALISVGFVMTAVALLQAASGEHRIYGLWRPTWDWAVFGPYVNRNHFAGFLVLVVPLAVARIVSAARRVRHKWKHRARRGWLALGDPEGQALVRRAAAAVFVIVGLLASQSRGGLLGFAAAAVVIPWAVPARRRTMALLAVGGLVVAGVAIAGVSGIVGGFEARGIAASRVDLWKDTLPMVPDFPVFGVGFDAFSTAYPLYQTLWPSIWFGEAHNEYLQALLDLGLVGAILQWSLLGLLLRRVGAAARGGALEAGLLASLVGGMAHNLVDFNWQIPANAAAWVALAGVALRASPPGGGSGEAP